MGGNCNLGVGYLAAGAAVVHGGEGPQTLDNFGFRVAFVPNADVPEPGSTTLAVTGALCLLAYAWRRRQT